MGDYHSAPMEVALLFCAVLALVFFVAQRSFYRATPVQNTADAKPAPLEVKETAPKKKQVPKSAAPAIPDLEDLRPLPSLIKETVRQMKTNSVKPYTAAEREQRLEELNAMPEVPNFSAQLVKTDQKLKRT